MTVPRGSDRRQEPITVLLVLSAKVRRYRSSFSCPLPVDTSVDARCGLLWTAALQLYSNTLTPTPKCKPSSRVVQWNSCQIVKVEVPPVQPLPPRRKTTGLCLDTDTSARQTVQKSPSAVVVNGVTVRTTKSCQT